MPESKTEVPLKAERTVHWPTGPVNCCLDHANKLVGLGRYMGAHVIDTPYLGDDDCINCVNEAKKKA